MHMNNQLTGKVNEDVSKHKQLIARAGAAYPFYWWPGAA
jgi:hypothetical protein